MLGKPVTYPRKVPVMASPATRTRATARFRARVARSGPFAVAFAARPNALSKSEWWGRIEGRSNTAGPNADARHGRWSSDVNQVRPGQHSQGRARAAVD